MTFDQCVLSEAAASQLIGALLQPPLDRSVFFSLDFQFLLLHCPRRIDA